MWYDPVMKKTPAKSPIVALEDSGLSREDVARFSRPIAEATVRKMGPWTKKKLRLCVSSYVRRFPEEFEAVRSQVNRRQWEMDDAGHAAHGGEGIGDMIALFEIPETLYSIIDQALSVEEMEEFKSQDGSRWFAREFPPFRSQRTI